MKYIILILFLSVSLSFGQNIAYTSFEEPSTGGKYYDTGDHTMDHALQNNTGEASVNYTSGGNEMGFSSYYYNTLNDTGLTDGDFVGVTDFTNTVGYFPDGVQGFQMSDIDGYMVTTFDEVDLSGHAAVKVSIQYYINETGWESADFLKIWVVLDGSTEIDLVNTEGSDIDDLNIEGLWNLAELDISAYNSCVLKIGLQSNAGFEAVYFDDVKFFVPGAVKPEPTNHVTSFSADSVAADLIRLTWTGSTGEQLPDKYLLLGKKGSGDFPAVSDGSAFVNDMDWSDDLTAVNIGHQDGENAFTFDGLTSETEYAFKIYPYTNSGSDIDYKTDGQVPTVTESTLETPTIAIADIQTTPDGQEGPSPYDGQIVSVSGIVSGKSQYGYFVQDAAGPWSGIYVYDQNNVNSVSRGDLIEFAATVDEYYDFTELKDVSGLNIISSGNNPYDPVIISTNDLAQEKYESVLVKVENAACTNENPDGPDNDYGQWEVDDGSGPCLIDDLMFPYEPVLGKSYTITGINYYSFEEYKIEPRDADDIQLFSTAPLITEIGASTRVPLASEDFTDTVKVTDNGTVTLVELHYQINDGPVSSVAMQTTGNDSTFAGAVPASAYTDGDRVSYRVYAEDNEGESDSSQTKGFFAGTTDINTLTQLNNDQSLAYEDYYARTNGVATVSSQVFDNTHLNVYIQDDAYGAINVFQYNMADVGLTKGNSYTVIGRLFQYNGLAQISPETEADIVDNGAATMPEPLELNLATLLSAAETFEGVLVKVAGVDSVSGGDAWPSAGNNANIRISDDGGASTITLRIDKETDIDDNPPPQWPQDVTGIFSQYDYTTPFNEGYQIIPRASSDLSGATAIDDGKEFIPMALKLHAAYPNPFNPSTNIRFDVPRQLAEAYPAEVAVYSSLGQKITTLVAGKINAGSSFVRWNGQNASGQAAASGIYFIVLKIGNNVESQKVVLMK